MPRNLLKRIGHRLVSRERRDANERVSSDDLQPSSQAHRENPNRTNYIPDGPPEVASNPENGATLRVPRPGENVTLNNINDQQGPGAMGLQARQKSTSPKVEEIRSSPWALAYQRLQQENAELTQKFEAHLGISTTNSESSNAFEAKIVKIQQKAFQGLLTAKDSHEMNKTSAKIKQYFEKGIKIIISSKGLIDSVVAANPYAALAWSGVSLLLPLLLNPTKENEAAMEGLAYIIHLLRIYRRQEESRSHSIENESEYNESIVTLYTSIMEYELMLLAHARQSSVKGWVKDVFQPSDWTKRAKAVQQLDLRCKEIANVITGDENRRWQDELLQQPRQEEQRRHMRMLYSNYEAGKNFNPERIAGTCQWFLDHTDFLTWRESQSSKFLWLSADPGCGKSVLAKYLVDRREELLSINLESPTVCYFFFKDGDLDRTDGAKALNAILHQLFMQLPELFKYAEKDFENKNDKFLTDLDALWAILTNAAEDSTISEFICVLDALDECQARSRESLIKQIVRYFSDLPEDKYRPIVKFLVTSRPEYDIIRDFKALTKVRLRGEDESEQISQEINLVIDCKFDELGAKMDLEESERSNLRKNLKSVPQRTYLWLYLTLQAVEKQLEFTKQEIAAIVKTVPRTVDEAYTKILDKSPNEERARKLLHIILAATRPLDLREVNVAMVLDKGSKDYKDLEFWKPEACADKIKNLCGLLVTVVDSKVYLIHQTAREFLIWQNDTTLSPMTVPQPNKWRRSFRMVDSNLVLAEICVFYLQLGDFGDDKFTPYSPLIYNGIIRSRDTTSTEATGAKEELGSKEENESNSEDEFEWPESFDEPWYICQRVDDSDKSMLRMLYAESEEETESDLEIKSEEEVESEGELESEEEAESKQTCELEEETESIQSIKLEEMTGSEAELIVLGPSYIFLGYVARYWAHHQLRDTQTAMTPESIKIIARKICNPETHCFELWTTIYHALASDLPMQASALIIATHFGLVEVVKFLLGDNNIHVNSKCLKGRTSLSYAASTCNKEVLQLLLEREDVQVNLPDIAGRTPLTYAARKGWGDVVELLLKREDVRADYIDKKGRTALIYAIQAGHDNTIKLLLAQGLITISDHQGRTPFLHATAYGHKKLITLLLEFDLDAGMIHKADHRGWTPLHLASLQTNIPIVNLLLDLGANIDAENVNGATPLHLTSVENKEEIIELLLNRGAQIGVTDCFGNTPLHYAAFARGKDQTRLLLERGADVNAKNKKGNTPLHKAIEHQDIIKLLSAHGALADLRNNRGETPLALAVEKEYFTSANVLRKYGNRASF